MNQLSEMSWGWDMALAYLTGALLSAIDSKGQNYPTEQQILEAGLCVMPGGLVRAIWI